MTGQSIFKFAGGLVLGFAGLSLVLVVGMGLAMRWQTSGSGPASEWIVSPKAQGGGSNEVRVSRPGMALHVQCRGACDDIRIQDGPRSAPAVKAGAGQ